jgi:hypothetical protein
VRYSHGYAADLEDGVRDPESGLELPGLPAMLLDPEQWWSRPAGEWIARRLSRYIHSARVGADGFAWVLRGRVVGRSANDEPLLTDIELVGRLADCLLDEAVRIDRERLASGPVRADADTAALTNA